MPDFVVILQAGIKSPTEVDAVVEAEKIREAILEGEILDSGEGETLDIVQVVPLAEDPTPVANILQLKRARNILIRTRYRDAFATAQEIDKMAHALQQRLDPQEATVSYSYGDFMDNAMKVLNGENPL